MLQSVLGADAAVRIVNQHLLEEVDTLGTQAWHVLRDVISDAGGEIVAVALELGDASPLVCCWRAHNLEDFQQLILFVLAGEEGLLRNELGENAPNGPHVDAGVVVLGAHEDVWRSVPEGDDLMREVLDWNAECSRQAKVSKLQNASGVDQ